MTQVPIPTARPQITQVTGHAGNSLTIYWDHPRYETLPATELYQRGFWRFEMTPVGGSVEHRTTPWYQWAADAAWQDSVTIGSRSGFPLTAGTAISIRMYFEPTDDSFSVIPAYRTPIYSPAVSFTPTTTQSTTNYRTLRAPHEVRAIAGNQSVDVQWDWYGDNANVARWEIAYHIGSAPVTVSVNNAAARERGFTGLVNNREYTFRVRAIGQNSWNNSAYSSSVSATPVAPITLTPPTNFRIVAGVREWDAYWDLPASATGRTAIELQWQRPGETRWISTSLEIDAIEYGFDNVRAGVWNYRVRSVGDGRRYQNSAWVTTSATVGDYPFVDEIRRLRATSDRLDITISWRRPKVTTGIVGYQVGIRPIGIATFTEKSVTDTSPLDYSVTFSDLQPGDYGYRLRILGDGTSRRGRDYENVVEVDDVYTPPLRGWEIYCLFNAGGRTQSQMRTITKTTTGVVNITEYISDFTFSEGHERNFVLFKGRLKISRNTSKFTVGAEGAYPFEARMNILGMLGGEKMFACWGFMDGDTIRLDSGSDFLRSLDVNHPALAPLNQPTPGTFANLVWQANSFSAGTAEEIGSVTSEYDHIQYSYPEGTTVLDALKVVTLSRGGYLYQDGFGRIQSRNWIQVNEPEPNHSERHIGVIGEVVSNIQSHYGPHYNFIEYGGETFLNNDSINTWGTSKLKLKSFFADPGDAVGLLHFAGTPVHHYRVRLPFAGPMALARYCRLEGDFSFGGVNAAYHIVSRTVRSQGPLVRAELTLLPESAAEDEFIIGQARIGTSEIL